MSLERLKTRIEKNSDAEISQLAKTNPAYASPEAIKKARRAQKKQIARASAPVNSGKGGYNQQFSSLNSGGDGNEISEVYNEDDSDTSFEEDSHFESGSTPAKPLQHLSGDQPFSEGAGVSKFAPGGESGQNIEPMIRKISKQVSKEVVTKRVEKVSTEIKKELAASDKKYSKLEETLNPLKDLQMLTMGGSKILDAITKHVIGEGFNKKIRELRNEFFSREEFQNQTMRFTTSTDLDRVKKDLVAQISSQKGRLQDLSMAEKEMNNGVSQIKTLIDQCCSRQEYEDLFKQVEKKANYDSLNRLHDELRNDYQRIDQALEFKDDVEIQFEDLKDLVTPKAEHAEMVKLTSDLKDQIKKNFEKTSIRRDCEKDKSSLQRQIDKNASEIDKLKKMLRKLEKKQDEQDEVMDTKVDIEDHEDVKDLILQLPKVQDVEDLKNFVTTNIEQFSSDNQMFHSEFKTQNEIIRRYDEVLAQKTSKVALQEQLLKIDERFKESKLEAFKKIEEVHLETVTQSNKLEDLRELVSEEIDSKISKQFKKERQNRGNNQAAGQGDIFAGEGGGAFKKMLALKADKIDLDRAFEIKCNKVDIENILDIQSIMSKQFKHVLVLFIEIVNCQQPKANEPKQAVEKRIKNLIKQVHSLQSWVMNFDPIDFMNSADAANLQMLDKVDEANFKDFTDLVLKDLSLKRSELRPTKGGLLKSLQKPSLVGTSSRLNFSPPKGMLSSTKKTFLQETSTSQSQTFIDINHDSDGKESLSKPLLQTAASNSKRRRYAKVNDSQTFKNHALHPGAISTSRVGHNFFEQHQLISPKAMGQTQGALKQVAWPRNSLNQSFGINESLSGMSKLGQNIVEQSMASYDKGFNTQFGGGAPAFGKPYTTMSPQSILNLPTGPGTSRPEDDEHLKESSRTNHLPRLPPDGVNTTGVERGNILIQGPATSTGKPSMRHSMQTKQVRGQSKLRQEEIQEKEASLNQDI